MREGGGRMFDLVMYVAQGLFEALCGLSLPIFIAVKGWGETEVWTTAEIARIDEELKKELPSQKQQPLLETRRRLEEMRAETREWDARLTALWRRGKKLFVIPA